MRYLILILISFNYFLISAQELENNSYNEKFIIRNKILCLTDSTIYSGEFFEYYPGDTKTEGKYLNGIKEGEFLYYYEKHILKSKVTYSKGLKNGFSREYSTDRKSVV